jgi:hypothetical protein
MLGAQDAGFSEFPNGSKKTHYFKSQILSVYTIRRYSAKKKVQPLGYYFKHLRLNLFTGLPSISISHDLLVNITLVLEKFNLFY